MKYLAFWLLFGALTFALPAHAQLFSLNQPGDAPCPAHLWLYGSVLNGAGDAIPSCFPQLTNGSVLFGGTVAGNVGGVTQDNAHLFWSASGLYLGMSSAVVGAVSGATLSAGELAGAKIAASGSAPGAGFAKMEWVAGTTLGTCKLIAYAGTSATPATIVDNVGAGC